MKKQLLFGILMLSMVWANAQTVFYIQAPSPLEGSYGITYVGQAEGTTDWGSINMDDPANVIINELVFAYDGSEADSLLCDPDGVINGDDVDGKIAVYYRGACEFGFKALAAQNAGAVAAVIINNQGDPIEMGAGEVGIDVTIPVAMISTNDGITLRSAIEAGGLTVFFGNKSGYYDNDMGLTAATVLRAEHFAHPTVLAQSASDYNVKVGANLINYGVNTQTNVSLNVQISRDGNVLYDQTSDGIFAMSSGDTVTVDMPDFSQEPFLSGMYHVDYNIVYSEEDEFPSDNTYDAAFMISDSLFSYARIDENTGEPFNITGTRPGGAVDEVRNCLYFKHPNGGLVEVEGMTFAGGTLGDLMTGEVVDIYVYEWNNEFTDLDDPNFDLSVDVLSELTFGSYEFEEDLDNVNIYVPFEEVVTLEDDVRYLFCVSYFSEDLLLSHDSRLMDYAQNLEYYNQPLFPTYDETDGTQPWYIAGFGTNTVPALTVNMKDPLYDDVSEQAQQIRLDAYPNPTSDVININVPDNLGKVLVDVYDVTGKQVHAIQSTLSTGGVLRVDVSDLENGAYVFNLKFENGSYSNINVVVTSQ